MKILNIVFLLLIAATSYGQLVTIDIDKTKPAHNKAVYQQEFVNREDSTQSAGKQEKHLIPGTVVDDEKGAKERKTGGLKHNKSVRKEER